MHIRVNQGIFYKDPMSSKLGRSLLTDGVGMIDTLGLELFTFKKLADLLKTTESSVYRYFKNKHFMLLYLINWYWGWTEQQLLTRIENTSDPEEKLQQILEIFIRKPSPEYITGPTPFFDVLTLERVVIAESAKGFLTKEIEEEYGEGFFTPYRRLCTHLAGVLLAINPTYPYPATLSSTILEGIVHQKFLSRHMPALTEARRRNDTLLRCYMDMIMRTVGHP